jgi:hypothetical protein
MSLIVKQDENTEDFLEHFGVKGMHWGQRKSIASAGVSKVGGAAKKVATWQTNRQIDLHKQARDGKGTVGLVAKLDKVTWGRNGRFEKYHDTKIAQLEKSNERIAAGGKLITALTIVKGAQYSKLKKN